MPTLNHTALMFEEVSHLITSLTAAGYHLRGVTSQAHTNLASLPSGDAKRKAALDAILSVDESTLTIGGHADYNYCAATLVLTLRGRPGELVADVRYNNDIVAGKLGNLLSDISDDWTQPPTSESPVASPLHPPLSAYKDSIEYLLAALIAAGYDIKYIGNPDNRIHPTPTDIVEDMMDAALMNDILSTNSCQLAVVIKGSSYPLEVIINETGLSVFAATARYHKYAFKTILLKLLEDVTNYWAANTVATRSAPISAYKDNIEYLLEALIAAGYILRSVNTSRGSLDLRRIASMKPIVKAALDEILAQDECRLDISIHFAVLDTRLAIVLKGGIPTVAILSSNRTTTLLKLLEEVTNHWDKSSRANINLHSGNSSSVADWAEDNAESSSDLLVTTDFAQAEARVAAMLNPSPAPVVATSPPNSRTSVAIYWQNKETGQWLTYDRKRTHTGSATTYRYVDDLMDAKPVDTAETFLRRLIGDLTPVPVQVTATLEFLNEIQP